MCPECKTDYKWYVIRENKKKKNEFDNDYILESPKTDEERKEAELYIFNGDETIPFSEDYFDFLYECHACCKKWLSYAFRQERLMGKHNALTELHYKLKKDKEVWKSWEELVKIHELAKQNDEVLAAFLKNKFTTPERIGALLEGEMGA